MATSDSETSAVLVAAEPTIESAVTTINPKPKSKSKKVVTETDDSASSGSEPEGAEDDDDDEEEEKEPEKIIVGVVAGFGADSYRYALDAAIRRLAAT